MQELIYIALAPIIAFICCLLLWLAIGRDAKLDRAVYPLYEPPSNLGVLECGILLDDVMHRKDLAYELYNLILNDYIKLGNDNYIYLQITPTSPQYKALSGKQ